MTKLAPLALLLFAAPAAAQTFGQPPPAQPPPLRAAAAAVRRRSRSTGSRSRSTGSRSRSTGSRRRQPQYGQPQYGQSYPPQQPYYPRPKNDDRSDGEIGVLYATSVAYGVGMGVWVSSEDRDRRSGRSS